MLKSMSLSVIGNYVHDQTGRSFEVRCINGVEYLVRYRGYNGVMSPHLKPDGLPHTCNSN